MSRITANFVAKRSLKTSFYSSETLFIELLLAVESVCGR